MQLGYISGPYTADTQEQILANISAADAAGRELLALGYCPVIPHKNTAGWEADERFNWQTFIDADLELLARCDFVLLVGDWQKSRGAQIEVDYARDHGIFVYADISLLRE